MALQSMAAPLYVKLVESFSFIQLQFYIQQGKITVDYLFDLLIFQAKNIII